jgi:hypothetical protein
VQTASPSVYSFHSATASIHSKWAVSPPPILPPQVLTPGVVHSTLFFQLQDPPSTYRVRKSSEPNSGVRDLTRRSYTSPVTESSFQRRGSDGQWWTTHSGGDLYWARLPSLEELCRLSPTRIVQNKGNHHSSPIWAGLVCILGAGCTARTLNSSMVICPTYLCEREFCMLLA